MISTLYPGKHLLKTCVNSMGQEGQPGLTTEGCARQHMNTAGDTGWDVVIVGATLVSEDAVALLFDPL